MAVAGMQDERRAIPRDRARDVRFALALAAIVVAGVVARAVYVFVFTRHVTLGADATWYYLQSGLLRHGNGYVDPRTYFNEGREVATGAWPPLYPAYLSLVNRFVGDSVDTLRVAGCFPATVTIALTGVLGRRVFRDDAVALLGATAVALLPFAIANDSSLMSETLSVPFTLGVLLAGHAISVDPGRLWRYAVFGAVAALGALARADTLITASVVLVVALVATAGARPRATRVAAGLVATVVAIACVLAPWSLRNHDKVGSYSITTTSFATAMAGSNCETTYGGRELGYWSFACIHFDERTGDNELAWSHHLSRLGKEYAFGHTGRWPLVFAARVARVWGAWDPRQLALDEQIESRRYAWQFASWAIELPLLVLATAAVVAFRRRWREIAVLPAACGAITVTAILTYGNQRFRAPAEPALALLAAWSVCALARRSPFAQAR